MCFLWEGVPAQVVEDTCVVGGWLFGEANQESRTEPAGKGFWMDKFCSPNACFPLISWSGFLEAGREGGRERVLDAPVVSCDAGWFAECGTAFAE